MCNLQIRRSGRVGLAGLCLCLGAVGAETTAPGRVTVVDGVVQPRRPVAVAITEAMQFLRRADGAYVPGRSGGELAGYFMSAHVNPDGSRPNRPQLSFPARQHAYFIQTFLQYYAYTGEREWQRRAADLADWNLAHSTPAAAAYPFLPYSAHQNGRPTGSADQQSIETDKPAFLGTAYLALFESTGEVKYLEAARRIGATLLTRQRDDGSWPFRVIPADGVIFQDLGGAPVFFVEFFERLERHDGNPAYRRARDRAAGLMITRHVEQRIWGTYHEDIPPKEGTHLSAEPMSFTAAYLFRAAAHHPEYLDFGRRVLRQMEEKLVHTRGHAAAPAPAVAEQATFAHIMPGHTARYCQALAQFYLATGEAEMRRRALAGFNAVTYMQSAAGLFRTFFYDTRKQSDGGGGRPDWYSQHLYTVCHLLATLPVFPERVPDGETRILGSDSALGGVRYAAGSVAYTARLPAVVSLKLAKAPRKVQVAGVAVGKTTAGKPAGTDGWSFDSATRVLEVRHAAGGVTIEW